LTLSTRFLDSLHHAVTQEPIVLDFVYGNLKDGLFIPLDGQQRLTTLFLLHWYAAKSCDIDPGEYKFLYNFSYETRYSARDFCTCLVGFTPSFKNPIKQEIIEQAWFPYDWEKDPTISSMLTMLNDIQTKFADVTDLWKKLKKGAIKFYVLPLEDMGLSDDLYIKMNSRGKPLTMFEHFKAELEKNLRSIDTHLANEVIRKVDQQWTDLIWPYAFGDNNIIDDKFLRYFHFVCDIICYKNGDSPQNRKGVNDEFDLIDEYFSKDNETTIRNNVKLLIEMFDIWVYLYNNQKEKGYGIADFFEHFIAKEHEANKVKANVSELDLLKDCMGNYGIILSNGNRKFPLGRTILLYAFVTYLRKKDKCAISEEQFIRRLRTVNNLIQNSEFEISDSTERSGGNRMPNILEQVENIVISGKINTDLGNNFNDIQLDEETKKLEWTTMYPERQGALYELEDNELLYGQIGIVGLDNWQYFSRFINLFENCDLDKIDQALMSIDDYTQLEQNKWRYQSGSSNPTKTAWKTLFHHSRSTDKTKEVLLKLLGKAETFSDEILDKAITEFLTHCEENKSYNWRYYYVKYNCFRPGRYGIYWWREGSKQREKKPYDFVAFWAQRQSSRNAYQVFIKALAEGFENLETDPESYGDKILLDDKYHVDADNETFYIKDNEGKVVKKLSIDRDKETSIDKEERVLKARQWLKDFLETQN